MVVGADLHLCADDVIPMISSSGLMCASTSLISFIMVVKRRRRRKSLFARLFFSCAQLADRTNGSCVSSIARQMVANAFRFFLLNVPWSSSVMQRLSFTSPLTTSHRSRSSSTICILNVHERKFVSSDLLMREVLALSMIAVVEVAVVGQSRSSLGS